MIDGFLEKTRLNRLITLPPLVTVVRLDGVIGAMGRFRGLSMTSVAGILRRAFFTGRPAAVALCINSPGGSPVQSALIGTRIRQLAEERNIPVFAFIEDVAASGGYWLACAADEIYANENSIVGSIGVISSGFGLQGLIERMGIERRVHAQGARKGMLDPFRPEDPDDLARLEAIQAEIFESFKKHVRTRRKDRLKADEAALFNGDIWSGGPALDLGLVDGLGDLRGVMRQRFGTNVRLHPVSRRESWIRRTLGMKAMLSNVSGDMVDMLPGSWASDLYASLEERALWARFGL